MNILITGSHGFVGKNLKEYFEKNKKNTIFAPTIGKLNLTDPISVKNYFNTNYIESIMHSATTTPENKEYPADVCESNLKMFSNIMKYKNKDAQMVNLGSGSEYSRGNWIPQMKEEYFNQYIPQDGHSYSKYLISKYIELSNDKRVINLRIFGIFGKYEDYTNKFISNCIAKNLIGLPIKINQNVIYDYLYINDFCRIVEHLINNQLSHNIMNITPTESIDLVSINNYIQSILGIKQKIEILKEGYGKEYTGDNSYLLENLGNFEFTPIKKSIEELIAYYKENINLINRKKLIEDTFLKYAKKLN
jgi:UDP-glucose 4-epimerase|tara:strand:- start:1864 stop:2778 length:915 start_codon:yes stop_codon:yes gene_type:complete